MNRWDILLDKKKPRESKESSAKGFNFTDDSVPYGMRCDLNTFNCLKTELSDYKATLIDLLFIKGTGTFAFIAVPEIIKLLKELRDFEHIYMVMNFSAPFNKLLAFNVNSYNLTNRAEVLKLKINVLHGFKKVHEILEKRKKGFALETVKKDEKDDDGAFFDELSEIDDDLANLFKDI